MSFWTVSLQQQRYVTALHACQWTAFWESACSHHDCGHNARINAMKATKPTGADNLSSNPSGPVPLGTLWLHSQCSEPSVLITSLYIFDGKVGSTAFNALMQRGLGLV